MKPLLLSLLLATLCVPSARAAEINPYESPREAAGYEVVPTFEEALRYFELRNGIARCSVALTTASLLAIPFLGVFLGPYIGESTVFVIPSLTILGTGYTIVQGYLGQKPYLDALVRALGEGTQGRQLTSGELRRASLILNELPEFRRWVIERRRSRSR